MQKSGNTMDIHIIANAALGPYLSGGDRIFIECARRWASQGHKVTVYVWEEGLEMCRRNNLEGVEYVLWPAARYRKFGFAVCYAMRTLVGIKYALKMKPENMGDAIIYSASDFWTDSLPASIMRRRLAAVKAKWIAGFYLFAPNPFKGFRGAYKKGIRLPGLRELLYYIHQKPVYWLIRRFADMIFVTCEDDRLFFMEHGRAPHEVVAVRGGVDARQARERLDNEGDAPGDYDACFVGRFHPQKGVIELVSIWRRVCDMVPGARLAVIGADSPEYRGQVVAAISRLGLNGNITLLGFMDGEAKFDVFRRSRMVLHPAVYDSGGMAACEGMAWGLPGVSFDLPALKTYYPKGMIKTPCFDLGKFAENVVTLIKDEELYKKMRSEALDWAMEWDWDRRAGEILHSIRTGAGI